MPHLDSWEQWRQKVARKMIAWLHSWDNNINIAPRESRRDNVIGLIWHGRATRFNILTFRDKRAGLEMGLLLRHDLADKFEKDCRDAGLNEVEYSDSQGGRLLILLNPNDFEKHRSLLQRLLRTAYEQAIKPRSQMRRGI